MDPVPETKYAAVGETDVAYQVVGEGPVVVFLPQWFSNVEALWELPPLARFARRLSRFSRLVVLDKRGTGLSDPPLRDSGPFIEQFSDDVAAVLDAVGAEYASIVGGDSAGLMAMVFAASHPARVRRLVLMSAYARLTAADDYAAGQPPDAVEDRPAWLRRVWHGQEPFGTIAPGVAGDPNMRRQLLRFFRHSASPAVVIATRVQLNNVDIRPVLRSIRAPTLLLHRRDNQFISISQGRYLAEHMPNSRLVELPGDEHLCFFGDQDGLLDEIEEFLTGIRPVPDIDRMLSTVLFTDIVDSTAHASTMGDRAWHERLDDHDAMVRHHLERFRGREIKMTGDGFLATFDGPARAIQCGCSIRDGASQLGIEVRIGIHTGEIELRGDDVVGMAVNIGARIASLAEPGEVLASSTVKNLVAGSGIIFADRGAHRLKGVLDEWRLYEVTS